MNDHTNDKASKHRIEFNTDDVHAKDSTEYWYDKIEAFFDIEKPTLEQPNAGFTGEMALLQTSRIIFGHVASQEQVFYRDTKRLITDGLDHFIVQVFEAGGGQAEEGSYVRTGDLFVIDMAKPHRRQSTAFSNYSFVIPRDLDPTLTRLLEPLHDQAISGRHPLIKLIRRQMLQLWSVQDQLSFSQMELVMENSVEMIKSSLDNLGPSAGSVISQSTHALNHAIRDYIEHNLDKPLSVEFLSERFNISRAHLYRVFAAEDGVSRYVQERRLMTAYRKLLKNAQFENIFSIAASCGFKSESHFANSFKTRFGRTPKEVQHEGNILGLRTDGNRELLDKWLKDL